MRARLFVLLALPLLLFAGCASKKAGMDSPELPARHWLVEAPGIPAENKARLDAVVPNLYAADKVFNFDDCVFLTIQQSPLLVNSAVDIEIKRVALTDAIWKYLPEPRLSVTLTNNLTQLNMDERDTPGDYGRSKIRAEFSAFLPNPVGTYFEQRVQQILLNLAISTHRKAVGQAILDIAEAYLKLQSQRAILAAQEELLPLARELVSYWEQVESVAGRQGTALNIARQALRERELTIEKSRMQEVMDRTRLKIIAGVDPRQKFEVDTDAADDILGTFDGRFLKWEDRWPLTEDDLLLRAQVQLADYNIMVAWAQYIPDFSLRINNEPPAGQYQPPQGQEDTFLHLSMNFPLLDWGRRYRGVQTARMQKAQAFHELARKRTEYSNRWLEAEQAAALARTELALQTTHFETARMQYEEARISFNEGSVEFPTMVQAQEAMVGARISMIEAELQYRLALVRWMFVANILQETFLGEPAKEFE